MDTPLKKIMSPEKQRIAIAEACGWRFEKWVEPSGTEYELWTLNGSAQPEPNIPDYLNDLNAMHEAEATLTGSPMDENSQKSEFSEQLIFACNGEGDIDIWFWHQIHATAAQRAEAFLKTIGKWEEE